MPHYLRLITVGLSLLMFAAALTVCGAAGACACDESTCCEETGPSDRLRDDSARIVKCIGDSLAQPATDVRVVSLMTAVISHQPEAPIPLGWKVARLRI